MHIYVKNLHMSNGAKYFQFKQDIYKRFLQQILFYVIQK